MGRRTVRHGKVKREERDRSRNSESGGKAHSSESARKGMGEKMGC